MKKASLNDLKAMRDRGEIAPPVQALEGESLGRAFWAKATLEPPRKPRSVHLKLDPDVFEFFYAETGGKGHLTRMQSVLKAYVKAKKAG